MKYAVEYTPGAVKALRKLDRSVAVMLYAWIEKNLQGCDNPRAHGKALSANLAGLWRYRVGDYRLIAQIRDETVTILILEIGHRREVYRQ